nr:MAG TPA: hypothetical protein [Caudoviricetes sp.]
MGRGGSRPHLTKPSLRCVNGIFLGANLPSVFLAVVL